MQILFGGHARIQRCSRLAKKLPSGAFIIQNTNGQWQVNATGDGINNQPDYAQP